MDLPTIQQLRYLVNLYDNGSFHAAAAACFVSQSTLSTGIKNLETQLNSLLVDRSNRVLVFTESGEEVVVIARKILEEAHDIVNITRRSKEHLTGTLKLGMIPTVMPFILPKLIHQLAGEYPRLDLQLTEEVTDTLIDRLQAGILDLILIALPYRPAERENLHHEFLFEDQFHVAFHPDMPCACSMHDANGNVEGKAKNGKSNGTRKGQPAAKSKTSGNGKGTREAISETACLSPDHIPEFPAERLLLLSEGHCLRGHALSACAQRSSTKLNTFELKNLYTLLRLVDENFGFTYLPQMAVNNGLLAHTSVMTKPVEASRKITMIWRKSSSRDEEFRLLGDVIRRVMEAGENENASAAADEVSPALAEAPIGGRSETSKSSAGKKHRGSHREIRKPARSRAVSR